METIKTINPGQTVHIGAPDHLTQIQHKGDRVDIVDHLDHGPDAVKAHIVNTVTPDGKISQKIY